MVDRIRDLIGFPEDEEAIREHIKTDHALDALCREYRATGDELLRLKQTGYLCSTTDPDELIRRRAALEVEILTKIEGYQPV